MGHTTLTDELLVAGGDAIPLRDAFFRPDIVGELGIDGILEGLTLQTWSLMEGQRVNNSVVNTPTPEYVRVWWQSAGESTWYLMPSQYWTNGGGTATYEYGATCSTQAPPSYHTAFSRMIAESDVPVLNR